MRTFFLTVSLMLFAHLGLTQSALEFFLIDSVKKYRAAQPEKATHFARQAIQQSKSESQKAKSLWALGALACDLSLYDSSQLLLNESLLIFQSLHDSLGMADVFQGLGEVEENLGRYPISLEYYQRGYFIRKKNGIDAEVARSLNSIGNIYVFLSNYPRALENYLESLKLSEKDNNKKEIANAYNNIGMVYDYTSDYTKALEYYVQAKEAYEALGDKRGLAGALNNIGLIFKNKSQPEKCIPYYEAALTLFGELKSAYGVAALQNNMGVAYGLMNDQELALQFHLQALATNTRIGNSDGITNSNNSIGDTYLKQNQLAIADEYYSKALTIAKKIKANDRMVESFEGLARTREGMKDYKNALAYAKEARTLRDTLYSAEKSKSLYEMEQKYESALKEKQIAFLNLETKTQKLEIEQQQKKLEQRTIQLALVLASLLFMGIALYMYFSRLRYKQKTRLALADKEKQQAVLQSVYEQRMSISKDMHDEIGSGLTHISLLSGSIISKQSLQPQILDELQTISGTSASLVQSMSEIVWALNPQNETLENLASYLREQTYKYFEAFAVNYSIHLPEQLPDLKLTNLQRRNLFLVTKEGLNNALKYSKATQIDLSMTLTNKSLHFEINDNGQGFEIEKIRSTANGLKNMKGRMMDINGTFDISSSEKGTRVLYAMRV